MRFRPLFYGFILLGAITASGCCFWHHHHSCYEPSAPGALAPLPSAQYLPGR
jgi:hypothetical protein